MFNTALTPLHMGPMGPMGGPPFLGFLPGLLLSLLLVFLIVKLLRHGRVGPVRWDPNRTGAPGAPGGGNRWPGSGGPGHRHGPPWADGPWGRGPWAQPSPEDAALATLADRLAKGEISPEEYLERSTALRGGRKEG